MENEFYEVDGFRCSMETDENNERYLVLQKSLASHGYDDSVINIPQNVTLSLTGENYEIRKIGNDVFNCSYLDADAAYYLRGYSPNKSITIPDSVTEIGDRAFYWCNSITSFTLPKSLTKIGEQTFLGCSSLESFSVPDSVTEIGDRAFYDCDNLKYLTLPNSWKNKGEDELKRIGLNESQIKNVKFRDPNKQEIANGIYCKLNNDDTLTVVEINESAGNKVKIPSEFIIEGKTYPVKDIDIFKSLAFNRCIKEISFPLKDEFKDAISDMCYNESLPNNFVINLYNSKTTLSGTVLDWKNQVLPLESSEYDGAIFYPFVNASGAILDVKDKNASVINIPSEINGIPICDIAIIFEKFKSLESVTIPDSVEIIQNNVFEGCDSLTKIQLPKSWESKGKEALEAIGLNLSNPNLKITYGDQGQGQNENVGLGNVQVDKPVIGACNLGGQRKETPVKSRKC